MSLETNKLSSGAPSRRYRYSTTGAAAPAGNAIAAPAPLEPGGTGGTIDWRPVWWGLVAAAGCFYLLYSSNIQFLTNRWASDSGWSHGFVVPLICLFFIRIKWDTLRLLVPKGTWVGLPILLIGVCSQVLFRATGMIPMSPLSMLVIFFGTVLFIFGWDYLKILWLPIAYLVFSMPPPDPVYVKITTPMQELAAELGVQLLPFFGCEAARSGTVITVAAGGHTTQLNVEQACAGMRMLVAFFALAVALAYSTNRPVWQKLTLSGFALPIAILCNGLRVTLTGVLAVRLSDDWAKGKAHEYFGLLMLGPAMAMQLGVAWILDRIFVEVPDQSKPAPGGETA